MDQTPWSERQLNAPANKKAGTEARAKAGGDRVPNTKPSHALPDYAAEYESPAYGVVKISQKSDALHSISTTPLPAEPFPLDRFDTPDDEQYGNFPSFPHQPAGRRRQRGDLARSGRSHLHRKPERSTPWSSKNWPARTSRQQGEISSYLSPHRLGVGISRRSSSEAHPGKGMQFARRNSPMLSTNSSWKRASESPKERDPPASTPSPPMTPNAGRRTEIPIERNPRELRSIRGYA